MSAPSIENEGPVILETFEVQTIGNGYVVTRRGRPSSTDPMGLRRDSLFVATPAEIGEAVGELVAVVVRESEQQSRERR